MTIVTKKDLQRQGNIPDVECSRYLTRTYSGRIVSLWPPAWDDRIRAKDIASHLAKIVYFPESDRAPFTAAQYAVELAVSLKKAGPFIQLHGLLANAHEAYLWAASPAARAAEKAMTTPALCEDRRDTLEESMRVRIFSALKVPDFGPDNSRFANAILYQRERLDATLERDIGAYIHALHGRPSDPFPRIIRPLRWDLALERYVRCYEDLTALCGLPAKD